MPTVTRQDLGAWLLRCNPQAHRLPLFGAGDAEPIRSWCVRPNYRSRLMAPGDLIVLWVSGQHPVYERGIWGAGRVRSHAYEETSATRIDVDIRRLPDGPLTDRDLRAAGLSQLEVQRQPQGSNPSWISAADLAMIESRLGSLTGDLSPASPAWES